MNSDIGDGPSALSPAADVLVPQSGQVRLMLSAVFRIGSATNNIRWSSVQALERDRAVAWVLPISLGDSQRGFPEWMMGVPLPAMAVPA